MTGPTYSALRAYTCTTGWRDYPNPNVTERTRA